MTTPTEALAALRDGDRHDPKPFRLKLDTGLSIEAPSPKRLAEVFVLPLLRAKRDVFRDGKALKARPKGSDAEPTALDLGEFAAKLRRKLAALPELGTADAGRPYGDVRLFVSEGNADRVEDYLAAVVRAAVTQSPRWRPPAPKTERAPARSRAVRLAAQREREKAVEEAVARDWLTGYLTGWDGDEEAPAPGDRVGAVELYAAAEDYVEEFIDAEIEFDDGTPYRVPRKSVFYRIADELLGERERASGGYFYTIPAPETDTEEEPMSPEETDLILDRVVDRLADRFEADIRERLRSGDKLGALLLQRDRLASTGTDGVVVDLYTRRTVRH